MSLSFPLLHRLSAHVPPVWFRGGRRYLAAAAFLPVGLGSCGSPEKAAEQAALPGAAGAAVELPGKALFQQNCALCHGPNGKLGINGARDLTKSNLNQNGRVYIVTHGMGKMPAFGRQLTPEQIEQVAAYSLTLR